jgi:hypothetical protein
MGFTLLHPLIDLTYIFLEAPIVEDNLGTDDDSRHKWEKKVFEVYGQAGKDIIENNKLRKNVYSFAVSTLDLLPAALGVDGDISNLQEQIDPVIFDENAYKALPTEKKKEIISELHRVAVKMLNEIVEVAGQASEPSDTSE